MRRPLAEIGNVISGGIPVLVPEIALLYKAHEQTEKNEADFQAALTNLSPSAAAWLVRALQETTPEHPWVAQLCD